MVEVCSQYVPFWERGSFCLISQHEAAAVAALRPSWSGSVAAWAAGENASTLRLVTDASPSAKQRRINLMGSSQVSCKWLLL